MANQEQVKLLKKSVIEWNVWRSHNSMLNIDLSYADLHDANLREANLLRANLSDAYLFRADFGLANLSEANLSNADLFHANFLYTDLSGVDLNGATLISTNLRGAILDGAKFKGARLYNTLFINVDISEVKELEEVVHVGPSYIGIDTIYNSKGKIPHKFLMGAGVPESFIECMNSLTGNAFDYYSCFISYSSKDEDFAKRLYADLQTEGVRCWFAPEDLKIGQKIRHGIDEAIKIHDKLLIVLSESSVKSDWVEKEVETAFEKERKENKIVLFPVRLDDTVMDTSIAWAADIRRTRNIGDFKNWKNHTNYKKTFDRLMQDLKADETKATESSSV